MAAILDMQISQFSSSTRAIYQKKLRGLDEYWRLVSVFTSILNMQISPWLQSRIYANKLRRSNEYW